MHTNCILNGSSWCMRVCMYVCVCMCVHVHSSWCMQRHDAAAEGSNFLRQLPPAASCLTGLGRSCICVCQCVCVYVYVCIIHTCCMCRRRQQLQLSLFSNFLSHKTFKLRMVFFCFAIVAGKFYLNTFVSHRALVNYLPNKPPTFVCIC